MFISFDCIAGICKLSVRQEELYVFSYYYTMYGLNGGQLWGSTPPPSALSPLGSCDWIDEHGPGASGVLER